mmetsp:Transcript_13505/g.28132  ORF Transcript_13505/g.28132 Transcript_13505/m.28132 type:complete len:1165 (+) Transcript_13505:2-3496(+)
MAGAAASAHALFGYNRENFLFDRKMRQATEFKILEFRKAQAELWRDDIRDIIGLTEKKMDSYLIVNTLQLAATLGLFSEGRLEPGTPPWLLHFYMLTLGASFMYLLMSVWLAMHASVVAQCSSVRLLTQFVRLPVPTWHQLEDMRTYAQSTEDLSAGQLLRVPFTGGAARPAQEGGVPAAAESSVDPWGLERHGNTRELYELQQEPAVFRRHIVLARRAAKQYQCFDAFARVSMSFGTNQLLNAIAYYTLGYVAVQDGAPWAAWCIVAIMTAIAMALVHLDFSLTRKQQLLARTLIVAGPACSSVATCAWAFREESVVMVLLPIAYASHGLWLCFALVTLGLELQPNGAILPMRFRAVLYLDIWGWLGKGQEAKDKKEQALECPQERQGKKVHFQEGIYEALPQQPLQQRKGPRHGSDPEEGMAAVPCKSQGLLTSCNTGSTTELTQLRRSLRADTALWQSDNIQRVLDDNDRERVERMLQRAAEVFSDTDSPKDADTVATGHGPVVKLRGHTDCGIEVPYLYDPASGETQLLSPSGQVPLPPVDEGGDRCSTSLEKPPSLPMHDVRSITMTEEGIERYCSEKALDSNTGRKHGLTLPKRACTTQNGFLNQTMQAAMEAVTPVMKAFNADSDAEVAYAPLQEVSSQEIQWPKGFASPACTTQRTPKAGIGRAASATVVEAPDHAFHPVSYGPSELNGAKGSSSGEVEDDEDIITGHDRVHPGRLPARIFRYATMMLIVLWAMGLTLPFGVFRDFMTKPLTAEVFLTEAGGEKHGEGPEGGEIRAAIGTAPDGLPELIPEYSSHRDLPALPEGKLVSVNWPTHSGFVPRSLSCDPSGTQLVVADDLGVYAGRLTVAATPPDGPATTRVLSAAKARSSAAVSFQRVPPCTALEGQALKDIGVVCPEGARGTQEQDACRVVVLHARGRRLAECPLPAQGEAAAVEDLEDIRARSLAVAASLASAAPARPSKTWTISSDWLHSDMPTKKKEYVESVAVNSECLDSAETGRFGGKAGFRPDVVGCVVVGTTSGRIVQLRGALSDPLRLVPERAMQQRPRSVGRGSLHVFPSGYVMALRRETGSVQAFDSKLGRVMGEWRLPRDVRWLTLCGGGDSLFVLGLRNRTSVELHRFPVPAELRLDAASPAAHVPSHSAPHAWRLRSAATMRRV